MSLLITGSTGLMPVTPPLPLLSVLRGGPLAPCLRQLLCNDSLMDISTRRGLYTQVLQLQQLLAAHADLLPVLLQPADTDVLASFTPAAEKAAGKRPREADPAAAAVEALLSPKRRKGSATKGRNAAGPSNTHPPAGPPTPLETEVEGDEDKDDSTSCWRALLQLRMQAELFRRNARALEEGENEEDVLTVAMALEVLEACDRVQQAVEMWQLTAGAASPSKSQQPPAKTSTGSASKTCAKGAKPSKEDAARAEAALQKSYLAELKPLSFTTFNLMSGGDFYFRSNMEERGSGDVHQRLRRITKEISSLPGQLPVGWESSILVGVDDDRMDVLRAVIFAPPGTPYAHGTFVFDIKLPPDYPREPPRVQFLTTGAGKVRFNPNLYANGKCCLSLLGTWEGPGWNEKTSTLLQVLISIQAMILGVRRASVFGFMTTLAAT